MQVVDSGARREPAGRRQLLILASQAENNRSSSGPTSR